MRFLWVLKVIKEELSMHVQNGLMLELFRQLFFPVFPPDRIAHTASRGRSMVLVVVVVIWIVIIFQYLAVVDGIVADIMASF
jgi:hypothetical protein